MKSLNFVYDYKPISKLESLSKALKVSLPELVQIVEQSNYLYSIVSEEQKPDGSVKVTYKAKPKLRGVLDSIRTTILSRVEYPEYILAGQPKKGYMDNVQAHISPKMLITEDVKSFFPSISAENVEQLFLYFFNFSPEVSKMLSQLSTKNGFLVQGSPVSGDIANLIFFRHEPKLAEWCTERNLRYTRYYDDIHISSDISDFSVYIEELKSKIYRMFGQVGVKPHRGNEKSRIVRDSSRICVHDVTVNSKKTSPSKQRLSKCRQLIFDYEISVKNRDNVDELIKKYRSIAGKIETLKQQGYENYKKLANKLSTIVSEVNEEDAKKYIRKYRKIKSKSELMKFGGRVAVLKKINIRIRKIVEAERKSAYAKKLKY